MADNTTLNTGTGGDVIATDDIGGVKHQLVKLEYGILDSATLVSASNPLPVVQTGTPALPTGAATSANQLPNNHNVVVTSAPTTAVTGPLTDTQLRATSLPVSGAFFQATQPVSATSLPLPTGASTEATLALIKAKTDNIDVLLSTRTKPADTQTISGTVTANAGTNLNTSALALDATLTGGTAKSITRGGAKGTTVAADITSNPVDANTQALHVDGSKVTQPVSGTVSIAANSSVNVAQVNGITTQTGTGVAGTGTQRVAVASDSSITANAGTNLNTSALALDATLATRLADATFTTRIPVQGQATMAASVPVTIASNQSALPISPADTTASGTMAALNATVALNTGGQGTSIFEITGVWVGTITFEGSNNNFTTVQAITAIYLGGVQTQSSTTTINGYFSVVTAGFAKVRANMTAYTSGTATVLANGSASHRIIVPLQGNPQNNQTLSTVRGGAKGATTAADMTSTAQSVDRQALDVQIRTSAGVAIDSFGGGSQYAEGNTTAPATGTVALARYQTAPPTLTNGQLNSPMLDISGNLKVNIAAGSSSGTQYVDGTAAAIPTGTAHSWNDNGVQRVVSALKPIPVTVSNSTTSVDSIAGDPIVTTAPGVQGYSLMDELGDSLSTTNKALNVQLRNPLDIGLSRMGL